MREAGAVMDDAESGKWRCRKVWKCANIAEEKRVKRAHAKRTREAKAYAGIRNEMDRPRPSRAKRAKRTKRAAASGAE